MFGGREEGEGRKRRKESGPVLSSQEELQSLILYSNLNTVCLISRWKIVPLVEEKGGGGGVSD